MLDREQEVVILVKQRQTFSACLSRGTKYGRLELDIEKIVVEMDPLCMPSGAGGAVIQTWEIESILGNGN